MIRDKQNKTQVIMYLLDRRQRYSYIAHR
jgi:hypothetical protein